MKAASVPAAAALLMSAPIIAAHSHHGHEHFHKMLHKHHLHKEHAQKGEENPNYRDVDTAELKARGGAKCSFPSDDGLVAITSSLLNGGWAMSPDMECSAGTWCPIACPPGQVMAQWKPDTTYTYPQSTYGGIYCNENGEVEKPFEDQPMCVDGTGTVEVVNELGGDVIAFCQTVLPGFEDMLIPTEIYDTQTIAVPDITYWDETSAQYYVNGPGVTAEEGCVWGDSSKPNGNWAYYVAGANTVADGSTYVQLSQNPIWQSSALSSTPPTFGLEIICPNDDCNGTPCRVDADGITSPDMSSGAGGADFCVVTVPKGSSAQIKVFNLDGSGGDSSSSSSSPAPTTSSTPTPTPTPTTSSTTSTTSSTTSSTPTPTSTSSSSSSSSTPTPSSTSSSPSKSPSSTPSESPSKSKSSHSSKPTKDAFGILGGVFQENGTSTSTSSSYSASPSPTSATPVPVTVGGSSSESSEPSPTETETNEASGNDRKSAALGGLIVALVAAGYML